MNACRGRWSVGLVSARGLPIVALLICVACAGGSEPAGQIEPAGGEGSPVVPVVEADSGETLDEPAAPIRLQVVELYFPAVEDDGLVAEAREIFVTSAPGDRAKQILADLIAGPSTELALRALPRGTRLRQVYVLPSGVAYVDFSDDLRTGLGGGTKEELLAVYSIVDSVVLNIPEIERVSILIDGEPVETLNGHIDLRWPLGANVELIVGRVASIERPAGPDAIAGTRRVSHRAARSQSAS